MDVAEGAETKVRVPSEWGKAEDTFREPPQPQLCFVRDEEVERSGREAHTPMKKREIYKSIII